MFYKLFQLDNVLRCDVPGPIKSGGRETIEIIYDVSNLRGGHLPLQWNNIEVYSKSDKLIETDLANNKGKVEQQQDGLCTVSRATQGGLVFMWVIAIY